MIGSSGYGGGGSGGGYAGGARYGEGAMVRTEDVVVRGGGGAGAGGVVVSNGVVANGGSAFGNGDALGRAAGEEERDKRCYRQRWDSSIILGHVLLPRLRCL